MAITLKGTSGYQEANPCVIPAPALGDLLVVCGTARSNGSWTVPALWTGQTFPPPSGNPAVVAWKAASAADVAGGTSFDIIARGFSTGGGNQYCVSVFSGFPLPARQGVGGLLNPGNSASPDTCASLTPGTASPILLVCMYAVQDSFQAGDCTIAGGGFSLLAAMHNSSLGDPFSIAGYRIEPAPAGPYAMQITHRNGGAAGASAIEGIYAGAAAGGGGFRGEPGGGVW